MKVIERARMYCALSVMGNQINRVWPLICWETLSEWPLIYKLHRILEINVQKPIINGWEDGQMWWTAVEGSRRLLYWWSYMERLYTQPRWVSRWRRVRWEMQFTCTPVNWGAMLIRIIRVWPSIPWETLTERPLIPQLDKTDGIKSKTLFFFAATS
jgi:hypothetical protein